ncbi:MAG: type II secretion system minor pseudopilin GspK [Candidatus Binatia bacterium]
MRTKKTTTKKTKAGRRHHRQRGVALILVLWTFAAVAVLAAEFARAMHDEAASTRNFKESTHARMIALAGVNEVILALKADRQTAQDVETAEDYENPDPIRSLSHGDGQWVPASFRGNRYEVRVFDEAGKLALNKLDATQLRMIFENLGIDPDEGEVIADSIIDWQDADDLHLTNGAESEYYEGLDRPYRAKNAWFDSVEELLLVRGVTREIFYGFDGVPGLIDIFSVFNQTKTINLNSVTPAVMQALSGIDPEAASEFQSDRRTADGEASKDELRALLAPSGVSSRSSVPQYMTIEARVHDASGTVVLAHVGAVVNLSRDGDGLKLSRWYDSIFDESDETGGSPAADTTS